MRIAGKFQWSVTVLLIGLFTLPRIYAEELKIGTVQASPRGFIASNNNVSGSSYDIANTIASAAGYSYTNSLFPYVRIIPYLRDGTIDLAVLVLNDAISAIATPIAHVQNVDFVLVGALGANITRLEDLAGQRVGYLSSSFIVAELIQGIPVDTVEVNNYESLIKMLMAKRIDAIIGPRINIFWNLREQDFTVSDVGPSTVVKEIKMYLVHSNATLTDARKAKLASAIAQLQSEGSIRDIIKNYDFSIH